MADRNRELVPDNWSLVTKRLRCKIAILLKMTPHILLFCFFVLFFNTLNWIAGKLNEVKDYDPY